MQTENERNKEIHGKVKEQKHVMQTLKRRNISILNWKTKYANLRKQNDLRKQKSILEQNEKVKQLKNKIGYLLRRQQKLLVDRKYHPAPHTCRKDTAKTPSISKHNNTWMKDILMLGEDDNFIETKCGRKFTSDIREVSYYLQDLGCRRRTQVTP